MVKLTGPVVPGVFHFTALPPLALVSLTTAPQVPTVACSASTFASWRASAGSKPTKSMPKIHRRDQLNRSSHHLLHTPSIEQGCKTDASDNASPFLVGAFSYRCSALLERRTADDPLEQEYPKEGQAIMGPTRPPTISFGAPGGADRPPPQGAHRGQPQEDANAEGGASQHEHGKNGGVHGALVCIPVIFRWSKGVASELRQRSQRFSIHKTSVRPRSPKGH